MPFEDEDKEEKKKIGLNKISSQKSLFDNKPKKPSKQEFELAVIKSEDKTNAYKNKISTLAQKYLSIVNDKTLSQNKDLFSKDFEKETISNMIRLAEELNSNLDELEGTGSLSWITILLKVCLLQRDRINTLEYYLNSFDKRLKSLEIDKK